MDLPIVLSHKTAWLYHNVARPSEPLSRASSLYDEDSLASEAEPTASLPKLGLHAKGLRASMAVGIVTDYLVSLGIPREELDHIDTLVNFDFERSTPAGFRCHVFGAPVPPGHLIEVAEDLLVVDEVMCFVQAGSWMSEPEQLEYGYEICARYHLNHLSTDDYVEMGQRYTVADLIAYCNENRSRQGGCTRGRRAQARVRWRAVAHGDGHRNHGRSKTFPGRAGIHQDRAQPSGRCSQRVQVSRKGRVFRD